MPLAFTPSRKQEDVSKVLEAWGTAVLRQIVEVSIDLSGNYRGLVHKLLPHAEVVADRFHVIKIVNQALDTARKAWRKANETNPDEVAKGRMNAALKQSKYALLKPEENLTEKQKAKLEDIREVLPSLAQMHQQKELLEPFLSKQRIGMMAPFSFSIGWLKLKKHLKKVSVQFVDGLGK